MTSWRPRLSAAPGPLYARVALALRDDIASGVLRPGARLPTHRELAQALGITVVTASRAYREAASLGLVRGEVGRGTFVGTAAGSPVAIGGVGGLGAARGVGAAGVAGSGLIELTANYIVTPDDSVLGAAGERSAGSILRAGLDRRYPPGGGEEHRRAAADWLRRPGWEPRPAQIVATSGAQHAILVALAALARPGDLVYAEALTYHGLLTAARILGLRLAPVAVDGLGLIPAALAEQCAGGFGKILFCQPSLHNPTSSVMPASRRQEVADIARRHDLTIVEDSVYEFLLDALPPPLAGLAPERTCHLVSGAKALSQGLRVGYVAAPEPLIPRLQAAIAATGLVAAPSLLDLATRWIGDGTARRLVEAKRAEVSHRQAMARESLGSGGLVCHTHPASSHLWLELPAPWSAAAFVEEARRNGVAVNPAAPFVVAPAVSPAAVRICLGPVAARPHLAAALAKLAALAAAPPPGDEPVV